MTPNKRQSGVTLPTELWFYVEDLRRTGLYGEATSAVVRTLICEAVQNAVARGIIPIHRGDLP